MKSISNSGGGGGIIIIIIIISSSSSSSSNVIVMTLNQLAGFLVHCFTSKRKCPAVQIRKRRSLGWFLTYGRPGVFFRRSNLALLTGIDTNTVLPVI